MVNNRIYRENASSIILLKYIEIWGFAIINKINKMIKEKKNMYVENINRGFIFIYFFKSKFSFI